MSDGVGKRSAKVDRMACDWLMLEALMAGTPAMRAAGATLMPKFEMEDPADHKTRIAKATLFPAFRRTVSVMSGKPFSKPLTLSKDTPAEIKTWSDDIDRGGVNLHTFAWEMAAEALAFGLCGILVEAPKPIAKDRVVTKAEEKEAGIRPYFVRVRHGQILGWKVERRNGATITTQLRLAETATVDDGDYGEKVVQRVRVLEPGKWTVWEKEDGAEGVAEKWKIFEEGVSGLPVVPFVPIYGWRLDFMVGVSPLLDLAYLNVKHWQDESDQDDSARFARKRMLVLIGGDPDKPLVASSNYALTVQTGGDVKVVQGSAESVKVGRDELAALEEQMIQAGAELLVKKPGDRSATESANDAEANKSDLQRITEGFEDSIDQALQFMAAYANLATGGNATLYKDFGAANLTDASAQLILSAEASGLIQPKTAILELQRRGTLSPEVDADEEVRAAAARGPGLGTITEDDVAPEDVAAGA